MNWLRRIMNGRYGFDQLSFALIILSLILTLISSLTHLIILTYIGYIPLILCILRMLSKNTAKRRMENYKFAIFMSPVYSRFNKALVRLKDSKTHRYFKCPNCKATLRLPKGKGKIEITCPSCKNAFIKKT